ncbi:MAG: hypothetical protein H7X95_04740 [Deltaproteobacteria bacterium]|nr:hypothetical protein [Deltaproteobacteria bacterium]
MLLGFIRQRPDDPFPRYALAMEYKNSGRLDEARQVFADLMVASPDYTASYLHAGNVFVTLGQTEAAREVYNTGVAACLRTGDSHTRSEIESAIAGLPHPRS